MKKPFLTLISAIFLTTSMATYAEVKTVERVVDKDFITFEAFDEKTSSNFQKLNASAIEWAEKSFETKLNGSDESIEKVEQIISSLHESYKAATVKPSDEMVQNYCMAFGSYIGETLIKNHGGKWGKATFSSDKSQEVAVQSSKPTKIMLFPWRKVAQRITEGTEHNLYDYYKVATSR